MSSKITVLSAIVTILVAVFSRAEVSRASYLPSSSLSHDQSCIVFPNSDLRSAYLQRAGMVQYDESNRTPDGLRKQLQRHFDVVLSVLSLATPDSIEVALVRLEAADD